jgi:hypothetical protein
VHSLVHADVVSTDVYTISNTEGWRGHALLVGIAGHGFLGLLHAIAEEFVVFVKLDGEVMCT